MKLFYIVNIGLHLQTARSVQLLSNAQTFYQLLGDDFRLYCPDKSELPFARYLSNGGTHRENSLKRKMFFHFEIFRLLLLKKRDKVIYSRNISIVLLAILLGYQCVWEAHDKLHNFNSVVLNWLKSRILLIVSISEALKNHLVQTYGITSNKIFVAHDGVFVEDYDKIRSINVNTLRSELGIPQDRYIIMHTGSLYQGRGMEFFKTIAKEYLEILFIQVGGTKKDIQKWRDIFKTYTNIYFYPHQNHDTLIKFQLSADALFLPMTEKNPIWWCTSPMKLFEYMATGLPIISTNIGSISEVLNDTNSITFSPNDEQSLVNAVKFCINNQNAAQKIGLNALQLVRSKYTWEKRCKKIIRIIKTRIND